MTAPALGGLPEYQRYDCRECGKCCRGLFTIVIQPADYERISAQGWEHDPALREVRLFVPHGKAFRLAHRDDGACVFLDETNRCRIHAKFGEQGKPLACRLYPFKFIPAGSETRVDLRFDCAAVTANHGRPLAVARESLLQMLPLLDTEANLTAPFRAGIRLPWARLELITGAFLSLLSHRAFDLTQRVVGCVHLSTVLRHLSPSALRDDALESLIDAIVDTVMQATQRDPMERLAPSAATGMSFRQLLTVYGREDRWGKHTAVGQRVNALLRMLGGRENTPSLQPDFPSVPFETLEEPLGIPPDEVVEPLERCLRVRLESMGFFGKGFAGYAYLEGLNALLLTYPAIFWFARAYAAGRGLPAPDTASIERGIQCVNHTHGLAPIFAFPLERYHLRSLCAPAVLRKLIVWYGR